MAVRRGTRARMFGRRLRAVRNHSEGLLYPGIRQYLLRQAYQLRPELFFDRAENQRVLNIDPDSVFRLPVFDIGAQMHWPAFLLNPESDTGILLRVWAPGLRYDIENTSALGTDVWGFQQRGLPLLQGTREYSEIMRTMGGRITRINETTRQRVMRLLAEGVERGEGGRTLAQRIERVIPGIRGRISSPARARMIARTEAAFASAESSVKTYELAGVELVDIEDGPECGWFTHNERPLARGQRVPLERYQRTPLAHPNCRRVAIPVVR